MKKLISSFIVVAILIAVLAIFSSCGKNTIPNSNNDNAKKEFNGNLSGIWMLIEDNTPYYSVSFLTINDDMNMTGGVYPGSYGRTCEISEIQSKDDSSFQAVLYYPETEETDMDAAMPESKEVVLFSSDNAFRSSFVIEYENGERYEFKYIANDFDKATVEFDQIINSNSSPSSSTNQNQQPTQQTAVYTYTHAALEGAVIIESDTSTGAIRYKKKCEKCGKVDSSTVNTYIKSGTLNSSFYCSNCKYTQKVRIQGTMNVDWE